MPVKPQTTLIETHTLDGRSNGGTSVGRILSSGLPLIDCALTIIGSISVSYVYLNLFHTTNADWFEYIVYGLVAGPAFALLNLARGVYRFESRSLLGSSLSRTIVNWALVWAAIIFAAFLLKISDELSRGVVVLLAMLGAPAIIASRLVLVYASASTPSLMREPEVAGLLVFGHRPDLGSDFARRFRLIAVATASNQDLAASELSALRATLAAESAKQLFVSSDDADDARMETRRQMLAEAFAGTGLQVTFVHKPHASKAGVAHLAFASRDIAQNVQGLDLFPELLKPHQLVLKRLLDLAVAVPALIILSPIMAMVALAVRLDSPGPIVFRQTRRGKHDRPFEILKFRSMTVMENDEDIRQARRSDPRVTRVGRIIRATSLDELPQLINVIRGDMSVVGPRPHALAHDAYYGERIPDYAQRRLLKPGVTGWAQVNNHRGETPSVGVMAARVELDIWYVRNWSLWLDLAILMKTAWALVTNRNVY